MLKYYYVITPNKPNLSQKKFFSPSIRRSGKNVNFGVKKIQKSDFYKNKKVAKIDDIH